MKRLQIIAIAVAVLLTGLLVIHLATPSEPSYQERTLTQWVREYSRLRTFDVPFQGLEESRSNCEHAIQEIGPAAIPTLLQGAQRPLPSLRDRWNLFVLTKLHKPMFLLRREMNNRDAELAFEALYKRFPKEVEDSGACNLFPELKKN
jgi:hypothetical protein